mgnify:CR=1 FL=1
MAQTKPKAAQFYGVSDNGTDGQFLKADGTGGMSWASTIIDPTITSIDYPGTQTAADPAGGESVIINGTLFASGITCTVGGTSAVTAFNSANQITITTPAKAAGQYTVAVTNTDGGTASQANFIQYSGVPVWSTASGNIGSVQEGETASFQVTATEGSDTIEYAVTTGTLPTGLSLATATGAITGTAGAVSADTTTTFSITATDDENQTSSARSFNITVTPDLPSNHFTPVIWSGNGSSARSISTGFEADMIWIKSRNYTNNHFLIDSIRDKDGGTTYENVYPNLTSAQANDSGITAIGSTSFTTGNARFASNDWVAWAWKAGGAAVSNTDGTITSQVSVNNTLGFSIAKYAGNGTSGATYGHGLDAAPELVLNKVIDYNQSWWAFTPTLGANKFMQLNTAAAATTDSDYYYSVSSSLFTLNGPGNPPALNQSGKNYITYNFTSKPGFSKVGTYTGNTTNLPIVSTGFEPAFLMIKAATITDSWFMVDNKRETSNPRGDRLFANSSAAEASEPGAQVNFLNGGFQITGSGGGAGQTNSNGATYLYLAFAADPSTTTPSLANSFSTITYSGNGGTQSTNSLSNQVGTVSFAPDLTWIKTRSNVDGNFLWDTLRGANEMIITNSAGPQYNRTGVTAFNSNGFTLGNYGGVNSSGYTYGSWNFKGGGSTPSVNGNGTITSLTTTNQAAGFSILKWDGNGTVGATVGHGLNAVPELFITKNIAANNLNWATYNVTTGNSARLTLNESAAVNNGRIEWNNTTPTASVVTFSDHPCVNSSGVSYIGYAFTSIPGYSKVGTYSWSGTSYTAGTMVTGLGFTPGLVIIKRINDVGNWFIFDNKRVSGTQSYALYINSTSAEVSTGYQGIILDADGFSAGAGADGNVTGSQGLNENGGTYIYLSLIHI